MIERDAEAPSSAGEADEEGGFADAPSGAPLPELPGYEVLRRLDSGGQGAVYSAYQANTGRRVAIKVLRESGGDTRLKEERLRREARFLSRLHHPNIVTIHDVGTANNQVYLVTDFIDGVPIDDHVNLNAATIREIVEVVVKVCDAVAVAHASGVIHRDLKPQNIVVDENNQPYVVDFGLAHSLEDNLPRLSETDAVVGTVEYLPPERISGHHPDTRSDVYALGLILYECIADQLPFVGDNRAAMLHAIVYEEPLPLRLAAAGDKLNPNTASSKLSRDLESVVMKAIARDVHERYQSAADMAADLRRFLNDEPVLARSTSTGYMLRRILRRYRVHVTAACIVLVMLIGSLVAVTSAWQRTAQMLHETLTALDMAGLLEYGENDRIGGRVEAAIRNFESAIALCEKSDSDARVVRDRLWAAHQRLAELYFSEGRTDEARPHAQRTVDIAFADTPYANTPEWRSRRAYAVMARGKIALYDQEYDRAGADFTTAASEFASLDDLAHVAWAHSRAGEAVSKGGSCAEAHQHFTAAIAIYQQLLEENTASVDLVVHYAGTEGRLASCYHRGKTPGDTQAAIALYRSAINRLEALNEGDRNRDVTSLLAKLHTNLAKAERLLRE